MTPTPVMTNHARDRCAEMGISTKVAKAIVRHANVTRRARPGETPRAATSKQHPDYVVIFEPGDPPVVLTVLFHVYDFAGRDGATYVREKAS